MDIELYRRVQGSFALGAASDTGRLLTLQHSRNIGPAASAAAAATAASLYRFTHMAFDAAGRRFAAADQRGDVFVFDLDRHR